MSFVQMQSPTRDGVQTSFCILVWTVLLGFGTWKSPLSTDTRQSPNVCPIQHNFWTIWIVRWKDTMQIANSDKRNEQRQNNTFWDQSMLSNNGVTCVHHLDNTKEDVRSLVWNIKFHSTHHQEISAVDTLLANWNKRHNIFDLVSKMICLTAALCNRSRLTHTNSRNDHSFLQWKLCLFVVSNLFLQELQHCRTEEKAYSHLWNFNVPRQNNDNELSTEQQGHAHYLFNSNEWRHCSFEIGVAPIWHSWLQSSALWVNCVSPNAWKNQKKCPKLVPTKERLCSWLSVVWQPTIRCVWQCRQSGMDFFQVLSRFLVTDVSERATVRSFLYSAINITDVLLQKITIRKQNWWTHEKE